MDIIDIFLKIIEMFSLSDPEEQQRLHAKCNAWRKDATPDNENKIKAMYAKAHEGIVLMLVNPFIYFFMIKNIKSMLADDEAKFID